MQQWKGIIAVNYAARASGVERFDTLEEAKKKCPSIVFLPVATFFESETEPKYHDNPHYSTHKVSLDVYRYTLQHCIMVGKPQKRLWQY